MVYVAELYRNDAEHGYNWVKYMAEPFIAKSHEHAKKLMGADWEHVKVIVRSTGISEPKFNFPDDVDKYNKFLEDVGNEVC